MNKALDIVFASDDNYLPHFTVALTSLLETNKDIVGRVFLLQNIKNKNKLKKSLDYFEKNYNLNIEVIFMDSCKF